MFNIAIPYVVNLDDEDDEGWIVVVGVNEWSGDGTMLMDKDDERMDENGMQHVLSSWRKMAEIPHTLALSRRWKRVTLDEQYPGYGTKMSGITTRH